MTALRVRRMRARPGTRGGGIDAPPTRRVSRCHNRFSRAKAPWIAQSFRRPTRKPLRTALSINDRATARRVPDRSAAVHANSKLVLGVLMAEPGPSGVSVELAHAYVGCERVAGALAWGEEGLVAFGAHHSVAIYNVEVIFGDTQHSPGFIGTLTTQSAHKHCNLRKTRCFGNYGSAVCAFWCLTIECAIDRRLGSLSGWLGTQGESTASAGFREKSVSTSPIWRPSLTPLAGV